MQRWIPSLIAAVTLAGSASLCQAQSVITYDFASGLQGWGSLGGGGTYSWNATGGSTGGGCMQIVFDGTLTGADVVEIDPGVTLPATLNEAQYLSVSVRMKIDPSSGVTGTSGSGGYGNLQAVFGNWDNSIWHGTLYPPAASAGYVTYTFNITPPYHSSEASIRFQLQGNATTGYTAPVTVYIDNVTITPLPNPWVFDAFTSDTSGHYVEQSWTGVSETSSLNTSQDAGGGATPVGALEINNQFPVAAAWAVWSQSWVEETAVHLGDISRFNYLEFDVKVDTSLSTLYSDGSSYGPITIAIRDVNSAGPYSCAPSSIPLTATAFGDTWHHLKLALPSSGAGGNPITNSPGFDIEQAGNFMGPVVIYIDNIELTKIVTKPVIASILPGTPGGLKMYVDADGTANNNDQEGITSPSADNALYDFFWINQTPATYSFTLTNFPAPAPSFSGASTAPASPGAGFDAHVYLVNGDSIVAAGQGWSYNQTYSGVPYNALDYLGMHVQNAYITNLVTYTTNATVITTNTTYGLASGVVAIIDWKTNAPNANATNRIVFNFPNMASANGTWSLNFTDNTHGNIVAADGSVNSFTLPDFYNDPNYTANFTPVTSMVQFGVFKNGRSANNSLSTTFTDVVVTNAMAGITSTNYNDSFSGPGLTGKYAWQVAEYYQDGANRTEWLPYGTAWWLGWGLSGSGYSVQSASSVTGPWSNAGVTYTYTDVTGTNIFGAVPAASLPAGPNAFFRLVK